jgi:hypothetical protein
MALKNVRDDSQEGIGLSAHQSRNRKSAAPVPGSPRQDELACLLGLTVAEQGARHGVLQEIALGATAAHALMRRQDWPKLPNGFAPALASK